jgi:hypothetical protein
MNTTKMLKDLLERVESGEVVITNFDVSNESVEFDAEVGSSEPPATKLTGEQTFYITTKPGVKKSAPNVDKLFGAWSASLEKLLPSSGAITLSRRLLTCLPPLREAL